MPGRLARGKGSVVGVTRWRAALPGSVPAQHLGDLVVVRSHGALERGVASLIFRIHVGAMSNQQLGELSIVQVHGEKVERGQLAHVAGVDVGALFDDQRRQLAVSFGDRRVQRRLTRRGVIDLRAVGYQRRRG
jgi:hypothetical protein